MKWVDSMSYISFGLIHWLMHSVPLFETLLMVSYKIGIQCAVAHSSSQHSVCLIHTHELQVMKPVFTRGQLWPSGIVIACVCVCVYVCVSFNHQFVRTITCHPLKLQSTKLDQKCKTPWLRSLLVLGFIDLDHQGQIELKSQNLPHFGLVSLSGP